MNFQRSLINWYQDNKRDLPWRNTTDPYVIWLSEIILQQTRVEQGLPYFNRFLEAYPTLSDFAAASQDDILKLWQGLGYYSRGRNMWHTAQEVRALYNGQFPNTYQDLIQLKGIGDYTAAAISSFAADENKAVLDGNVFRVLARYFGIHEAINSTKGKKLFKELAQELIEGQRAQVYNQAIMEFGALQCKPKSPNCASCPLRLDCVAFQKNEVQLLPVKLKTQKSRPRYLNYFWLAEGDKIYYKQRLKGDVWEGLYDLPLLESDQALDYTSAEFLELVQKHFGKDLIIKPLYAAKQVLSHQIIYAQFFALENYILNFKIQDQIKLTRMEDFKRLAHPKIIADFLKMFPAT